MIISVEAHMRVFVLGAMAALFMTVPAAQAQQVASLVISGKPATVQGIALGDGPQSCKGTIKPQEYGMNVGKTFIPNMVLQSCLTGSREDQLDVTYDSTGTKVVSITRTLYLNQREVGMADFFASIEQFYGPADYSDHGNWTVAYGSFEPGRHPKLLDYGTGLIVAGYLCGMQINCPSAFDNQARVTFRLSDQDAYNRAVAEGKQALKDSQSNRANAISF